MAVFDRIRRAFSPRDAVQIVDGLPRGIVGPWGTIGGGWPVEHDWAYWNRYNGFPGTAFGHGFGASGCSAKKVRGWDAHMLYTTQPHLQTVVAFRSRNLAQLPLHLYSIVEGEHQRVHGGLADLFTHPNRWQTGYEILAALVTSLDLYGRAYWLIAPSTYTATGWELQPIPADRVTPHGGTLWEPDEWHIMPHGASEGAEPIKVPGWQLVEFKTAGPDGFTSVAPVDALRDVLAEQIAAWEYRAQSWNRGARTSGYVYRPKDAPEWSEQARDRFTEEWHEFTRNGARAGETILLEDGMELRSTGFSPREEEWVTVAQLSLRTVCSVYHVPPAMVGAEGATSYASAREFRSMLYTETLGPLIRMIEQRINQFVLPVVAPNDPWLAVKFNIDAKLAGSFEEQASVLSTSTGAPWMTVNEARALRNLPALDGADGLVVPLNVTQGGQASPQDGGEPSVAVQNAIQAGEVEQ